MQLPSNKLLRTLDVKCAPNYCFHQDRVLRKVHTNLALVPLTMARATACPSPNPSSPPAPKHAGCSAPWM